MAALSKHELIEELTPNIKKMIFEIVKHASNIDPRDMERWTQAALRRNPYILDLNAYQNPEYSAHLSDEQIIQKTAGHFSDFLLPRMNFITGTDSAKVTAHRTGIEAGFPGDAATIAQEKLMKIPPLWVDAHIKRGVKLEYLAKDIAIEAGYNPRSDLVEAIKQNQQGHPFLRGTPDMVLERLLDSGESQLILTDFKVPYKAKGMAMHDYVMQLHHYTLCNILGNQYQPQNKVNINGLMLFEVALDQFNGKETPIAWDESFAQAILEEGAMVHEHFIQGRVPEIIKPTKHFTLAADAFVANEMSKITKLKLAGDLIEQKVATHQMNLENYVENRAPDRDCKISHDTLVVTTKRVPSFVDDSRAEMVEQLDISTTGKTNYKIDQEIVKKSKELGVPLNIPFTTKISTGFSRKGGDIKLREEMASQLIPIIENIPESKPAIGDEMAAELGEISTILTSNAIDRTPAPVKQAKPTLNTQQIQTPPATTHQERKRVPQPAPVNKFNF